MDRFDSAAEYLAYNGLDLSSLLARPPPPRERTQLTTIVGARLPHKPPNALWNVAIVDGHIASITAQIPDGPDLASLTGALDARGRMLVPALCHAHVHLDKCFLLHDAKYADLTVTHGDFNEALQLTNVAKQRFADDDLKRRGRRLLLESVQAGVAAMRAFVELDEVVGSRCLAAARQLQEEFRSRCTLQICVFAQLCLFSGPHAAQRRDLLKQALENGGVEAVGSTPYVERSASESRKCIQYTIQLAICHQVHVDFHLDYNIDPQTPPMVDLVIDELRAQQWTQRNPHRTVCLGHCTRLSLFEESEWRELANRLTGLPVYFVGLPTSDLFIQGRQISGSPPRATLPVPEMIQKYDLGATIAINNISNAFTPYGSCDPLNIASLGVGLYHAGRNQDAELLYECVSTRAAQAIGLDWSNLDIEPGLPAHLLLLAESSSSAAQAQPLLQLAHAVYCPHTIERCRV